MNALGNVRTGMLRAKQAIDQITQAVGLFNDDVGIFDERGVGQRFAQQLCCAAQATQRVFDLVGKATHQIARGNLLGVL